MTDKEKILCLINLLIGFETDIPCNEISCVVQGEDGGCWCENHCRDKSYPDLECWLKYLEVIGE